MNLTLKTGAINQIEAGTILYRENQLLKNVALVLKGKATLYNAGCRMTVGPGAFIGINDLYVGKSSFNCEIVEDATLYIFKAHSLEDIPTVLEINKEYSGFLALSINRYICKLYDNYYEFKSLFNEIYDDITAVINDYKEFVSSYGGKAIEVILYSEISKFENELPVKQEWIDSLNEIGMAPTEAVVTYYSHIPNTALREVEDKIKICTVVQNSMQKLTNYMTQLCNCLINDGKNCIFKVIVQSMMELAPSHQCYKKMLGLLDKSVELINRMVSLSEQYQGKAITVNHVAIEKMYHDLVSGKMDDNVQEIADTNEVDILNYMNHSLVKILSYAQVEPSFAEEYVKLIDRFIQMKDKTVVTDESRRFRKELTKGFFEIYEKAFRKAYVSNEMEPCVRLFLNYGYLDERLLTKEQIIQLYNLKPGLKRSHYCTCYTIYEWLVEIYEGRKEPSKSEMDMDYRDYVRHLRATKEIQPFEEKLYLEDKEKKLSYELENMFQHNMKLTNGRITTFVPFLYEDVLPLNLEKYYLTTTKVDEAIRKIRELDFSVFYREVIYTNPDIGIQRELVQKECVPDVLLFPSCGSNGIMWQEIADKKRDSSARFCLPILHESELENTVIKLLGRYRWEICRTLQGLSWNDIKNKCLTSEYSDYIQFYRKNKELSEERKEKLRQQLLKVRNNTRESFALDYEQWIKYESTASIRLTKPVRDIMGTYCPFKQEVRHKLMERPTYGQCFMRYEKEARSRTRILEAKALGIKKQGKDIPEEISTTIDYFSKN